MDFMSKIWNFYINFKHELVFTKPALKINEALLILVSMLLNSRDKLLVRAVFKICAIKQASFICFENSNVPYILCT